MDFLNVPKNKQKAVREAFLTSWLSSLESMIKGTDNVPMYTEYFASKSDEECMAIFELIRTGKFKLPLIVPNLKGTEVDIKRLNKFGLELGHSFYQNIAITDQTVDDVTYDSPVKAMVVKDYVRRQIQTSENKLSVPRDANVIDDSTGQVTGDSKGGAFSLAETRNLEAKELDNCIYEFLAPLGGNNEAYQIMEDTIIEQGTVTIEDIQTEERPGVIDMVDVLFRSAHIKGNW